MPPLCEVIRIAYDPAAARLIDEANAAGEPPELYWPEVGPTAHQAGWDTYRHDSALSVTWMMSGAPRGNVPSSVLSRLLAPHRGVARKRITLLYRPIDAAKAAAIVESDVRAASFNLTTSNKPTARNMTAARAAMATAAEVLCAAALSDELLDQFVRLLVDREAPTHGYLLTFPVWASARRTEAELTCRVLAIVSHVAGGV